MKHILSFLFVAMLAVSGMSQTKKQIIAMDKAESPKNADGVITYVVEFDSWMSDTLINKRAMHWLDKEVKSMRVQYKETTARKKIVGKAEMDLLGPMNKKGAQSKLGRLKYTFIVYIENNKCKAEITKINLDKATYFPVEKWEAKQDDEYMLKYYLIFVEEQCNELLSSFKEFVDVPKY